MSSKKDRSVLPRLLSFWPALLSQPLEAAFLDLESHSGANGLAFSPGGAFAPVTSGPNVQRLHAFRELAPTILILLVVAVATIAGVMLVVRVLRRRTS